MNRPLQKVTAFTLVEMLAVIAIVALVMAFAVPSVSDIVRAGDLSNGASSLVSTLAQARQSAIVQNRNVEVRFYRYNHSITEGNEFQAIQSFIATDDAAEGWKAFTRVQVLPESVILDQRSSLIQSRLGEARSGSTPLRGGVTSYDYVHFIFRPDGSTNLGPGQWYFLLRSAKDPEAGAPLPRDFFVVDVAPRWGQVRLYGR